MSSKKVTKLISDINVEGTRILNYFLYDYYSGQKPSDISQFKKYQTVNNIKEAGNVWFENSNLDKYLEKRYRCFLATRSQAQTNSLELNLSPVSLKESLDKERSFSKISKITKNHLCWLYQVLNKEDQVDIMQWLSDPAYAVTMQEFKAYFRYLEKIGVPVYDELSKDIKLKLQGLWKSQSLVISSSSQIVTWAEKEGVDAEKVLAFIKHLQTITGIIDSPPLPYVPISTQVPTPSATSLLEMKAKSSPETEQYAFPQKLEHTCKLHTQSQKEHLNKHPRPRSSSFGSDNSAKKRRITLVKKEPEAINVAKPKRVISTSSDPFRLFDNHPLRSGRTRSTHRNVQIKCVNTKSVRRDLKLAEVAHVAVQTTPTYPKKPNGQSPCLNAAKLVTHDIQTNGKRDKLADKESKEEKEGTEKQMHTPSHANEIPVLKDIQAELEEGYEDDFERELKYPAEEEGEIEEGELEEDVDELEEDELEEGEIKGDEIELDELDSDGGQACT